MDDYVGELVALVEEYKIHNDQIQKELSKAKEEVAHLLEERLQLQEEETQRASLWKEMEESIMNMDYEVRHARLDITNRDAIIEDLKHELIIAKQNERSRVGSQVLLHSATKDELKRIRAHNDKLQIYIEEMEQTVCTQHTDLLDMKHYIKELEDLSGKPHRQFLATKNVIEHSKNQSFIVQQEISCSPGSIKTEESKPDAISDIDVDIGHSNSCESPVATQTLATAVAKVARERLKPDTVLPISNRGDGSYGYPSPKSGKIRSKSMQDEERWAYPSPNSLPPAPPKSYASKSQRVFSEESSVNTSSTTERGAKSSTAFQNEAKNLMISVLDTRFSDDELDGEMQREGSRDNSNGRVEQSEIRRKGRKEISKKDKDRHFIQPKILSTMRA